MFFFFPFVLFVISCSVNAQPNTIPNLKVWFSADSVLLNGSTVQQWTDRSGNFNHAIQNNAIQQPALINSVLQLNSHPVVSFDGTDDFLEIADSPSIDFIDKMSIFIVTKQSVLTMNKAILCKWDYATQGSWAIETHASSPSEIRMFVADALTDAGNNHMSTVNANNNDTTFYMMSIIYNGNEPININRIKIFKNGNSSNTSVLGTISPVLQNSSATLKIGMLGGALTWYYNGDIAEIIIYSDTLTTLQRMQVELYLNNKYAPPVNLGADITVNNFCPVKLNAHKDWFRSYQWNTGATTDSIYVNNGGFYSVNVTNIFGFASSDTISVTYPGNFKPFPDTTICYGSSIKWNTQLKKSAYTFLWQNSSTDSVFTITQAGQYYVKVTDTFGCIRNSDTIRVQIDSFPLTASLGPDKTICSGENIFLTSGASQSVSYLWSPGGQTTSSIIITTTGMSTYTVTVMDTNQCTAKDTINITVKGIKPAPGFIANAVCFGDTTPFFDTSYVPLPDVISSWQWNFGDASNSLLKNPSHIYSNPGIYSVILTVTSDSGCSATIQKLVVVNNKPVAGFLTFPPLCSGSAAQFTNTSSVQNDSLVLWQWNFGDPLSPNNTSAVKNPTHTYNTAGIYSVQLIVNSSSGCKDTVVNTVTVLQPPVASFTADSVCAGNSTSFTDASTGNIVNWYWEFGDGYNSTLDSPIHDYLNPGTYTATLLVTDINQCTNQDTGIVKVFYLPNPGFKPNIGCLKTPLQILDTSSVTGSSIAAWNWNFGDLTPNSQLQSPIHSYSATGTYLLTLTVTSAQGCSNSVIQPVSVQPLPNANFSLTPTYGAPPLTVNFADMSSGGTALLWNFGDGNISALQNPSHTYQDTGLFTILLVSQNLYGCKDSATQEILIAYPVLDMAVSAVSGTIGSSNTVQISAILLNSGTLDVSSMELSSYLNNGTPVHEFWSGTPLKRNNILLYTFNSSFELLGSQHSIVCVEVKNVNGRLDDVITNNKKCASITNEFTLLDPFPNPATDEIYFLFIVPESSGVKAEIFDVTGRLVDIPFEGNAAKGLNQITYNTFKLSNGIYILKLFYGEKMIVKKFMKE